MMEWLLGEGHLEDIRLISVILSGVGQTIFVGLYLSQPWWSHFVGRALMSKSVALMLVLDVFIIHAFIDYKYEDLVLTVFYLLLAPAIWFQVFAVSTRIRQQSRRDFMTATESRKDFR